MGRQQVTGNKQQGHMRPLWLLVGLAAIAVTAVACGGGSDGDSDTAEEAAPTGLTQSDSGEGGVTVEVTWLATSDFEGDADLVEAAGSYDAQSYLLLRVQMDTHSGDLSNYDVVAGSELAVDGGPPQVPVDWRPVSDSTHHREGLLVFERPEGASSVELALNDLAGAPPRLFRWAPPPEA